MHMNYASFTAQQRIAETPSGRSAYVEQGDRPVGRNDPGTRKRVEFDGARLLLLEERSQELNDELRAHWSFAS
jgi:hypothetical protein